MDFKKLVDKMDLKKRIKYNIFIDFFLLKHPMIFGENQKI